MHYGNAAPKGSATDKNINNMKKKVISLIAAWTALTVCQYSATFAEVNTCTKIVFGIASAALYAGFVLAPFLAAKRKDYNENVGGYLMSLLNNE